MGEFSFENQTSDKGAGLILTICKKLTDLNSKKTQIPIKNWQRIWINIFPKNIQRHMSYSKSLIIRSLGNCKKTQCKNHRPVRMTIMKKTIKNKCW